MNFKEYITNEAFDKPYELTKVSAKKYTFEVNDDNYSIVFLPKKMRTSKGDLKGVEISFYKNESSKKSKSESPFRVFATVLEAAKLFNIKKYDYIEYSADITEGSKVKLYDKLETQTKKKLNWEYSQSYVDGPVKWYIIYKVKP